MRVPCRRLPPRYLRVSPKEGRLACAHVAFPTTTGWGRWGLGRIKNAIDWLMIPVLTLVTTKVIRNRGIAVILTVAHGRFFLAAALAGWITRTPYVVMMHDDTFHAERPSWVLKHVIQPSVRRALRGAAHVYSISSEMQRLLKAEYGVDSELQKPATERNGRNDPAAARVARDLNYPIILYAGAITSLVEDSLRLLAELIVSGKLKEYGLESAKFHVYTSLGDERKRKWGWNHDDLVIHPWAAQNELPDVLSKADILFLPFSFSSAARHSVETSFPSKTADYLASGTPILVLGPNYSTLVAYAGREGFAEIVSEAHADALARAIRRIVANPAYRQALSSRALQVFSQYHDIRKQRTEFMDVLNAINHVRSRQETTKI
jgi:glycosyltransferase involved in cell wall biosynthesis